MGWPSADGHPLPQATFLVSLGKKHNSAQRLAWKPLQAEYPEKPAFMDSSYTSCPKNPIC